MGVALHDRIVSDSQKIHNNEMIGGDAVEVTFSDTEDTPNELTIMASYNDISLTVDAETGMIIAGSKISIFFQQSDLTIWDGLASMQRWTVAFTNGAGQDISAEISQVLPDRSFGDVTVLCKIVSGHR